MGFRCEEVNEDVDGSLMVQLFGGYCFHNFLESETFTPMFGVVVCEHNYLLFLHFGSESL